MSVTLCRLSKMLVSVLLLSLSLVMYPNFASASSGERNFILNMFEGLFSKCMDELGCFDRGKPFFDIVERPLSLLPSNREDIDTNFNLYTRSNEVHEISNTHLFHTTLVEESGFDNRLRTVFIVPGFMSHLDPGWQIPLKDAFLNYEPCNVFMVDWNKGDGPLYEQAVANTRVVGAEIAHFISFLQEKLNVNPGSVHIVGHSLGAHIAGYAGKRIPGLGRITGLDPAGPYFENVDPLVRLNASDALFVDVIHSNSATNRFEGFGTTESIGHFDFFPNGGSLQPGCVDAGTAAWNFLKNPGLHGKEIQAIMCNHHRAIDLFTSSIRDSRCHLVGIQCNSWEDFNQGHCGYCNNNHNSTNVCVEMGLHSDQQKFMLFPNQTNLKLYLNTTATEPFCSY